MERQRMQLSMNLRDNVDEFGLVYTETGRIKMSHQASKGPVDKAKLEETVVGAISAEAFQQVSLSLVAKPTGRVVPEVSAEIEKGHPNTIIEFTAIQVVTFETDKLATARLRRRGDLSGRVECGWEIMNRSVVSNIFHNLTPKSGIVVFEPNEEFKTLELPVAKDPTWNVESLYLVLLDPSTFKCSEKSVTAALGENSCVSIYSVNMTSFPAGADEKASSFKLVWSFLVHNYTEIPRETVKGVLLMCLPPLIFYCQQEVLKMLLGCATHPGKSCSFAGVAFNLSVDQVVAVFVLVAAQIVLFSVGLAGNRVFKKLRLGGKATRMLRTNMFATMLQLSDRARDTYDYGDVPSALFIQTQSAVNGVWLTAFTSIDKVLQLLVTTILTVQVAASMTSEIGQAVVLASVPGMMFMLVVVIASREKHQVQENARAVQYEQNFMAYVEMAENCHAASQRYRHGWKSSSTFHKVHARFNKASASAADFSDGTSNLLDIAFLLIVSVVTIFGSFAVQSGSLEVAEMVVLINSVTSFGKALESLGDIVSQFLVSLAPVKKVQEILNQETRRKDSLNHKKQSADGDLSSSDIVLRGVTYAFPARGHNPAVQAVPCLNLRIPGGYLVSFPAHLAVGIHTLFKLISGEILPDTGCVANPGLHVVYIPVEPLLFDGSLMYNLRYGDYMEDREEQDVWDICRAIGCSDLIIGQADLDVGTNGEYLKFSDRMFVTVARALLANVDFLLINSALDVLGQDKADKLLKYLLHYVHNRGAGKTMKLPIHLRNRKSVLYATKYDMLLKEAEMTIDTSQFDAPESTFSI